MKNTMVFPSPYGVLIRNWENYEDEMMEFPSPNKVLIFLISIYAAQCAVYNVSIP